MSDVRGSFDESTLIAIPTLGRRPLAELISELKRQAPQSSIIIIFNGAESERIAVTQTARRFHAQLKYSETGYAKARNVALKAAEDFDFLIFIDDDQIPGKTWFRAITDPVSAGLADVVFGPVVPVLPAGAWASPEDLRPMRRSESGAFVGEGYSGNTLLKMACVNALTLSFDEDLNLIGGEDTRFFRRLSSAGTKFWYANEALAWEMVDEERLTAIGRFRRGVDLSRRQRALNGSSPKTTMKRVLRICRGLLYVLLGGLTLSRRCCGRGLFDLGFGFGYLFIKR